MPIDAIGQFGVFFDATAGAAPEVVVLIVEGLPRAGSEGQVVLRVAFIRQDRAQPVIEHQELVVIEMARVGSPTVKVPGELEHVVCTATLGGRDTYFEF